MISLRGRRAIVTGGSRGIGAATALMLAECGADVGIGYRSRADDAAGVVKQLADRGVRCFAFASDIATREGADHLFERAMREFGGVDIFVGNAGIWPVEPLSVADMDDDRWRHTINVNVDSIFFTARAAAR